MRVHGLLIVVFAAITLATSAVGIHDKSVCDLDIRGDPKTGKIAKARLHCTGPEVTVAVEGELSKFKDNFSGVKWSSSYDCNSMSQTLPLKCIVTVCGTSQADFPNATLSHLKLPGLEVQKVYGLCFDGTSRATLIGAKVSYIQGTGISASGESVLTMHDSKVSNNADAGMHVDRNATVTITDSTIRDNEAGGLSAGGNATVTISGESEVSANSVLDEGGGLSAWGNATVAISGGSVMSFNTANLDGGGLAAFDHATVTITNSTIEDNVAEHTGGGLVAGGNATVTITNSTIIVNKAERTGGGLVAGENATVTISGGRVLLNSAANGFGGGLSAGGNATVTISSGTVVSDNTARFYAGGGLAAEGNATLTITDTTCEYNEASISSSGGCVFAGEWALVSISHSTLFNNTASFGQGGGAVYVSGNAKMSIESTHIVGNWAEGSNGGGLTAWDDSSVLITGGRIYDNIADLEGGGVYVVGSASANITGHTTFTNNTSKYRGSDVRAAGDGNLVLGDTNINVSSPTVFWTRTQCKRGEMLASGSCQLCPVNTYNVDPSWGICEVCPDNAECPGGDKIIPKAGYWHSSNYSAQIHTCLEDGSCLDGGVCAEGYRGKLCGSCATGYGDTLPFQCGQCVSAWKTTVLFLSGGLALLLLISFTVHTALNDIPGLEVGRPSDYFKVLVRHMQYLLIVGSLPTPWPTTLSAIFKAVGWVFAAGNGQVVSLSCLFNTNAFLPIAIKKCLVYLSAPVVMWVLVIMCRLLGHCLLVFLKSEERGRVKYISWGEVVCSGLVVLFFFYPSIVRVGLGMFACYHLDDPGDMYAVANATYGYWVSDLDQVCYDGWHKRWALGLGIPITLVFCLCVPVGIWYLLRVNKAKLHLQRFLAIGFLCRNYKITRYYWEAISVVQLALVVAISVFRFNLGAYYATVLLNASFSVLFTVQYMFKPYEVKMLHHLQLVSFVSLSFTTTIALTLFTVGDVAAPSLYGSIIGVFGLLVNVSFALWCCSEIAKSSSGMLQSVVRKACACLGIPRSVHNPMCESQC